MLYPLSYEGVTRSELTGIASSRPHSATRARCPRAVAQSGWLARTHLAKASMRWIMTERMPRQNKIKHASQRSSAITFANASAIGCCTVM